MSRRNGLVILLSLGALLLAMGAVFVSRDVMRYQRDVRHGFQESCRRRAIAFEEITEQWIVHDELDSLETSAKFFLMDTGLYVDVLLQQKSLYSGQDDDLGSELLPEVAKFDPTLMKTVVEELSYGVVEVRTPLILTGYPDSPVGLVRLGFSGEYANSLIRGYALSRGGIGFGVWMIVMSGVASALWLIRRRGVPDSGSLLNCGTLQIDTRCCEVRLNGFGIELTPKLYEILLLFVRNSPAILSDQDILDAVWPDSTYAASPDVKQHIYLLRQKLAIAHQAPKRIIVNVKGFGYRLDPPTNEVDLSTS